MLKKYLEFINEQEEKIHQSNYPKNFITLSKAIEEAGVQNTYDVSQIEVSANIESGNIFINDEPLCFTIFDDGEVYYNQADEKQIKVGDINEYENLVSNLQTNFLKK